MVDTPALRVSRAWAKVRAERTALLQTLVDALESAPTRERARLAHELVQACPGLLLEPGVRAVLERHGGGPLPHTVESAAAFGLQELARWYVGTEPPLANADEVFAFVRKLKAAVDELLLGLVPLFAGLDRFEQQVALKPAIGAALDSPASARLPRVPHEAARTLFNWRDGTDNAVRAVRTDLVDLTMHQVAVLNGVMRGVKVLLEELSPEAIDEAWRKRTRKGGVVRRLLGSLRAATGRWRLYRERHADLADEENERFRVIFGPEFVAEYKQVGEASSIERKPQLPAPVHHYPAPPSPYQAHAPGAAAAHGRLPARPDARATPDKRPPYPTSD